jgi:hypothetical protein
VVLIKLEYSRTLARRISSKLIERRAAEIGREEGRRLYISGGRQYVRYDDGRMMHRRIEE